MLKGFNRVSDNNENIKQICITHAKFLRPINGDFSFLRKSGLTHERIIEEGSFSSDSMETCHNLWLSVTTKSNTFEDHAIDSMQSLNDMGDNTEDFI